MSDLFTLTLRRQHLVTRYDARGKSLGETATYIEEKHHDLPAQTVATYRRKFPGAVVSVEQQVREFSRGLRQSSARTQFTGRGSDRQNKPLAASAPRREAVAVPNYADAINAAVAKEARA